MPIRCWQSLHFKMALAVILTILILSTLYFFWDYRFYRRQALAELHDSARELSSITSQSLLELAMLGRHPELLQGAMERMGTNLSVKRILILDPSGVVRFASRREEVGRRLDRSQEGCRVCHESKDPVLKHTILYQTAEGEVLLRNVTLIPNRKQCHVCHDPGQPYNGVLLVDFPTSKVWAGLEASFYEMLVKVGVAVLAMLLVLGVLMNRLVITRLKKLTMAATSLLERKKDPRLDVLAGTDEIGQLAGALKEMESRVNASIGQLKGQKTYLQSLMNSLQDGLLVVDREIRIELFNPAAAKLWSDLNLEALSLSAPILPRLQSITEKCFTTGQPARTEINQSDRCLAVYCSPVADRQGQVIRVIVLLRDITEHRLFEKQISRAERLASVGQLAAGIAHEINNPMATISTCAEGLSLRLQSSNGVDPTELSELKEYLASIGEAASRCREITQRLLRASADSGDLEFSPVDVREAVERVIALVSHEAEKRDIEIVPQFNGSSLILGDREKVSQILLNLFLNSIEAIGRRGRITVAVAQRGDFVELKLSDNGCGIPTSHLERIFDPFFTTKREGRGTGLGLSICEGLVRQHQGRIFVKSTEGRGTEFTIVVPSIAPQPGEMQK